ncbi:MAG: hydrolase [Bacteroidetes bacterium GWC2_33_15]|nr:MAG: hydrolase [Bacteroidetes bacterium GWA2_33_15]OFX51338.1 MAG: hydrolase [Bacteroidetes bacterium GWC2_33_15]OFX65117.1 MAG: hydrolase [Bacteroidetes bacterium GWB2_32_14]OFX70714.1 MAG: hydrolase [Bacteroidetes bacterium GWD2_33_33]HAN18489.1 hydrolase [Bacteroidales bacterium]
MKIAVDFDGTIVDHEYPQIGKPKLFAFETLKALQKRGDLLILWTFRNGKELDEAIGFCKKNGIEFYAVNKSYPEEIFDNSISRKIDADIYIDDRNIGGFPGWSSIWQILNPEQYTNDIKIQMEKIPKRKKFTWNLFRRKNKYLLF